MTKKRVISRKLKPWITEEGLLTIEGWARDGLTNEQISGNIGINPKTLYDWIKKWPEIEEALRMGKEPVDRAVENALLKKALGYTEKVEKVKVLSEGEIVRYNEEVYYPPDTTAAIFWLKNRKPGEWRDQRNIEHSGQIAGEGKLGSILEQLANNNGDD